MSTIPLRFHCPGTDCPKDPINWCHTKDGGSLSIDTDADIHCSCYCGDSGSFIKSWTFKCNSGNHSGGYVGFKFSSLMSAIGAASEAVQNYFPFYDQNEMMDFLGNIQASLMKRWNYN